jgi:hypothetical protein
MRKIILLSLSLIVYVGVMSQKIKGPESISYFQAPSQGVEFKYADVFLLADEALQKAKKEAQQAKNSAMGSKFGALGESVANTANSAMDANEKLNKAVNALKDDKGRFAVWSFVPSYIIADANTKKSVIVEIYILNEPDPSPSAGMSPLTADKNGYYDVPYYINCRYKITTQSGELIAENNLGVLQGTRKSKNYTPPPAAGGIGTVTVTDDKLTEAEKIGINVAYNRVRQDVYGRFGFGTFSAPIKLGVVKEIKETKKLIKPVLAVFENKRGLLLSKEEKATVQSYVDIIESNINKCSDKTRWVAYHNLSVCYAWLEEPEKAKESYKKYGEEIGETIEKMRKWNLLLQGKLSKEERKGFSYIGMKDQKKFKNYKDIETFVTYYAAGASKYTKLFNTINRDLGKFVDYYAHNDLLCQLYEIDYPFQFFPLKEFAGAPKKMVGSITKEGMEAIDFTMKFDSKRRIKQLETEQVAINADGSKEKLYSRELKPVYDDDNDGRFVEIVTDAGSWQRDMSSNIYFSGKLNSVYDPVAKMTYKTANNITKNAGFFADKTSDEAVQLKVDLDGNIYFTGTSRYFKANAIFKDIISQSGIKTKRTDTRTDFATLAVINEQGVFDQWSWDGNVSTSFVSGLAGATGKVQEITADKMLRDIKVVEKDSKGNPTKVQYTFEMKGKLNVSQKMSLKEWFSESYAQGTAPKNKISSDGFEFGSTETWDCTFKYDEQGNWTEMKIGPYTATRTFKY